MTIVTHKYIKHTTIRTCILLFSSRYESPHSKRAAHIKADKNTSSVIVPHCRIGKRILFWINRPQFPRCVDTLLYNVYVIYIKYTKRGFRDSHFPFFPRPTRTCLLHKSKITRHECGRLQCYLAFSGGGGFGSVCFWHLQIWYGFCMQFDCSLVGLGYFVNRRKVENSNQWKLL